MNRIRLHGFLLAALIFVVDQATKAIVVGPLGIRQLGDVREVIGIFDLRFVPNVGVSLGLLPAGSDAMRWALVALTAAIAAGVAWWMLRERAKWDVLALGMVLGGAIGNILDRIRFGYVVDFADLHFGGWRLLVFNVADAAITIGVVILLFRAVFARDRPNPKLPWRKRMRKSVVLMGGAMIALALSGCGKSGYDRARPDEFAVARQAPLVIPPDFALVPPQPGAPRPQDTGPSAQALDAMFGGPAARSGTETSALRAAGRDVADVGVRSAAGDPETQVVDKGSTTRDIVAAPEGDGQAARAATGAAQPAPAPATTPPPQQ